MGATVKPSHDVLLSADEVAAHNSGLHSQRLPARRSNMHEIWRRRRLSFALLEPPAALAAV